ncbi:MAG: 1,4-alpha-glucan branching protein domain-containing protein [Methylomonas sp.]|jgi:1,4-alpha-glucan branching enzyme
MNPGCLCIVLHAHLPYVHHPEYVRFFEETWLFEAITECYLPLVSMLDRLQRDRVDYRLTLSVSPTLLTMWRDPLLQSRYLEYLRSRLELADQEVHRTRRQPEYQQLAIMYQQGFRDALCSYRDHYQCDLLAAFVKHWRTGKLEMITTAATHAYLPLLNISEIAVRNQIEIGVETFTAATGVRPRGFWLPECAYYPGLEKLLQPAGIEYFIVDSHGILNARPAPAHVYAPLVCENGVKVFGRDPASSKQVWSAQEGYPGDGDYREYYSDIGFQLELDYLAPYICDQGARVNTGFKYHRVTGGSGPKQIYAPRRAKAKARLHAEHFIGQRRLQVAALGREMSAPPIIVAPYDAELFGHWWYEGPDWLESVLRLLGEDPQSLRASACAEALDWPWPLHSATPAASSWGEHGHAAVWLNPNTEWIYPLLHKACAELEQLAADLKGRTVNNLQRRALNQAARSLLLAQASDWPFILHAGTTVDYAKKNITDHLARFNYLHDAIRKNRINERYVAALEVMDDIFPDLDFRDYAA